jgi:hypothetical protein
LRTQTQASWADYEKKILNPNPIVLDSAGYSTPIFSDRAYTIFLFNAAGISVFTQSSIGSTDLNLVQVTEQTWQFWDSAGAPLSFGKLYVCKSGASINDLKDTYTGTFSFIIDNASNFVIDNAGNQLISRQATLVPTPNANPIILDIAGMTPPLFTPVLGEFYKIFLFDRNNVLVLTQDQIGNY